MWKKLQMLHLKKLEEVKLISGFCHCETFPYVRRLYYIAAYCHDHTMPLQTNVTKMC